MSKAAVSRFLALRVPDSSYTRTSAEQVAAGALLTFICSPPKPESFCINVWL